MASREACSTENEQNIVTVEGDGSRVVFKQIAGLIARRIVFNKKPGDRVAAGERVGLIKFGSRVDVLLRPRMGNRGPARHARGRRLERHRAPPRTGGQAHGA